jgi:hypothetical protein
MDNDQPKLNPIILAEYIKEMGLKDNFDEWTEAKKPEAVLSNSTDWLCDEILTPIKDCSYQDKTDGCCGHDQNMTPECHHGACPRLSGEILNRLE